VRALTVGESRAFHERAKALGKPVTYVEFPGQGHHIEGLALQKQLYQARFDFLMQVAAPARSDSSDMSSRSSAVSHLSAP
jgi:acetyl esterase/lipase